jgi:hypothetical protein
MTIQLVFDLFGIRLSGLVALDRSWAQGFPEGLEPGG